MGLCGEKLPVWFILVKASLQGLNCGIWQRCGHRSALPVFLMDTIRAVETAAACSLLGGGGGDLDVTGENRGR